jgi:lipopolysaccharide biosynthesis glycosyltransferase
MTLNVQRESRTVVFAIDWRFFEPLLVAVYSLLDAWDSGQALRLVIVAPPGKPEQEAAIERLVAASGGFVRLERREPPAELNTLPTVGHLTPSTFTRIFLPDMLTDCDQLLYLDADILVRGDLSEWPGVEVNQHGLAARDQPEKRLADADGIAYCKEEPGFQGDLPLRNPGVSLINAVRWREEGVAAQLYDFALRWQSQLRFCDQDAINAVCGPCLGELPQVWNWQLTGNDIPASARVLHFTGTKKPWNSGITSPAVRLWVEQAHRAFAAAELRMPLWSLRRMLKASSEAVRSRLK